MYNPLNPLSGSRRYERTSRRYILSLYKKITTKERDKIKRKVQSVLFTKIIKRDFRKACFEIVQCEKFIYLNFFRVNSGSPNINEVGLPLQYSTSVPELLQYSTGVQEQYRTSVPDLNSNIVSALVSSPLYQNQEQANNPVPRSFLILNPQSLIADSQSHNLNP